MIVCVYSISATRKDDKKVTRFLGKNGPKSLQSIKVLEPVQTVLGSTFDGS
jgi:hypothetical protein